MSLLWGIPRAGDECLTISKVRKKIYEFHAVKGFSRYVFKDNHLEFGRVFMYGALDEIVQKFECDLDFFAVAILDLLTVCLLV